MKKFLLLGLSIMFISFGYAADTTYLYNPKANAAEEIAKAVTEAKKENKHVLIQAGGNWCSWCLRFNKFISTDPQIDSLLKAGFVVYHLNYSPENKNPVIFASYGFPQRFGFPVFLILNGDGKLIHTQNSGYLEQGKGYSKERVFEFLSNWTPASIDPNNYKDQ
jgi:thioredoxin-related protein